MTNEQTRDIFKGLEHCAIQQIKKLALIAELVSVTAINLTSTNSVGELITVELICDSCLNFNR